MTDLRWMLPRAARAWRRLHCCVAVCVLASVSTAQSPSGSATSSWNAPHVISHVGSVNEVDRLQTWARAILATDPIGPDTVQIRTSTSQIAYLTSIAIQADDFALLIPGVGGTALLMRIYVPATQFDELFTLFVPSTDPTVPRPLLTCFHAYGSSHLGIAARTTYIEEANARGWFLIAPLQFGGPGLFDVNFGSWQSQEHVREVIDFTLRNYNVDRDRLYGVGFSMGGGSALSYAARHRDRRTGAFAAVMNHTGTVALLDVFGNVEDLIREDLIALFNGRPDEAPFGYARSSTIELDASGQLIPDGFHMGVNLESMPILSVYGTTDTTAYLINQTQQFDSFMASLPNANHTLMAAQVPSVGGCSASHHCWDTADETAVCDWLAMQTLEANPSRGSLLLDRDERWYNFDCALEEQGTFARLAFDIDAPSGLISLTATQNVARIGFDPADVGLGGAASVSLVLEAADDTGDRIELYGQTAPPTLVIRDGVQVQESCDGTANGPSWCFDSVTGVLTLTETGPGQLRWTVIPG